MQERVASGINPNEMATGFSNTLGPQINQPMFPHPVQPGVQPGVQPIDDRALRSEVQPEDQLSGDNTLRSAVQPGVQPISGGGRFGGGYYGAGRTGNPYTIGTGGMPYTNGYFRSQFGNPYSGGFGGKGGMARPSYGKGGSF
jgi:hypothetical protein